MYEIYPPSLCFVVQGSKEVVVGRETIIYTPERYLLVSVSLPIAGRVLQASAVHPHLALHISLDFGLIADLLLEWDGAGEVRPGPGPGLSVGRIEPLLQAAVTGLVRLLDTPRHIPVLAPLLLRQLCYLLSVGPHGPMVRAIAATSSQQGRLASAIERLRRDYDQPLRIEALAKDAGMSVSSLQHQFKAVTALSPLQYLKQVRLHEARRLLLSEDLTITGASLRVGYQSATQFSREYRRLFGAAPRQDMARLRMSDPAESLIQRR